VAVAEPAGEVQEGLLALAVRPRLQVMAAMTEADVIRRAGPRAATPPNAPRPATGTGPDR
jgi:hypothetical protein